MFRYQRTYRIQDLLPVLQSEYVNPLSTPRQKKPVTRTIDTRSGPRSLVFYHVQTECGCEQNICSTDDDLDSVQLNADVNRTSARPMMTSTVSSHSLVFYHVQTECGCEQNICSTYYDFDSVHSQLNADVNRTSARPIMNSTVSSHSLVFYHVQTECGFEQNISSTDDDLDSVHSQLNADVNRTSARPMMMIDSVQSQLNADVNRTSARPMMTSTVSTHSLVFYHVQTECGCEQNICSTDDDVDSVQSQSNVLGTIKLISSCDVLRD
ncbi:hypothetical protein J6590_079304 [Homalodisca vitripennis]|nr:hypothetical protein J6590_079304 [Homalodisca vitripennis]